MREAYKVAVVLWAMRPVDFWALHPIEFFWLLEGHNEREYYQSKAFGDLTRNEADMMLEDLERALCQTKT